MAKARKRHLARQSLSDKLKEIRESLIDNKTAWHTLPGKRPLRVRLAKFDLEDYDLPTRVLVRFGNRLEVVWAPDKMSPGGGSLYVNDTWVAGHVPLKNVLAIVRESYYRDE